LALFDTTWYISSVAHAAVTARPQNTAVAAGVVRRQFTAPSVGNERMFVCIVAGTTANVTDATWVLTRGAKTTDGTATWQECTGQPAVNGDLASTATWAQVKAVTPAVLGQIIKRSSGASYQICTTAGAMSASEPSFSDTAGVTTTDTTAVWTSLGPVGNFSAWGAPHARLANAYAVNWGAAGHKFWIADDHAETQTTALTLTSPATAAAGPTYAICVDRTAAVPPVEANYNAGASISTTGASSIQFAVGAGGNNYYQGLTFNVADGSNAGSLQLTMAGATMIFKNCSFVLRTTSSAQLIGVGPTGGSVPSQILWDNCAVQFGAVGQSISLRSASFEWRNTPAALQGAIIPTVLFTTQSGYNMSVVCRGVDFSAFTGQLLMSNPVNNPPIVFEDCKFNSSMVRYGTSIGAYYSSTPVVTVRCDSGATNYKSTRDEYSGAQTVETSTTRVGGATDGTTATSDKISTNSQATFLTPYRMLPLAIWNETTGANVTVTVYGTINSASLPLNDELWMDVQYLGNASSPIASFKTTSKSHPLAANAAVASDSSTWNNATSGTFIPTTWNPADKSANFTLSNGDLTAVSGAGSGGLGGVRGVTGLSSGKYYFEITTTVCTASAVGVALSTNTLFGNTNNAAGVNASGAVQVNGVTSGTVSLPGLGGGAILCVAVDLIASLIWFRVGASGSWNALSGTANNPATGVGGVSISAVAGNLFPWVTTANAAENFTANFGATAFSGVVPSGFTAGWGVVSVWTPFKLVATLTSPQPQMKGFVYANVRAGKASATYYIDPLPALS
jgi:hypothetical protein